MAVLLKRFARDVQRKVLRVHHALHEAEVVGQQVAALFHDQHIRAVQCQALFVVLVVEVVRRALGDEQQRIVGQRAFRVHGNGAGWVLEIVEVGLVEGGVFLVGYLGFAALPDGDHRVDGLNLAHRFEFGLVVVAGIFGLGQGLALLHFHVDGVAHVVAVLLDEGLELILV